MSLGSVGTMYSAQRVVEVVFVLYYAERSFHIHSVGSRLSIKPHLAQRARSSARNIFHDIRTRQIYTAEFKIFRLVARAHPISIGRVIRTSFTRRNNQLSLLLSICLLDRRSRGSFAVI